MLFLLHGLDVPPLDIIGLVVVLYMVGLVVVLRYPFALPDSPSTLLRSLQPVPLVQGLVGRVPAAANISGLDLGCELLERILIEAGGSGDFELVGHAVPILAYLVDFDADALPLFWLVSQRLQQSFGKSARLLQF